MREQDCAVEIILFEAASHCQSLPVHILQARCAKKASQYEDRIARLEAEIARRAGNLQCPG
jgi:hypothetical protein